MNNKSALLVVIWLLSGCTTYYAHPNKSGYELQSDEADCKSRSIYKNCSTTPASSKTNCSNDGFGNTSCNTTYQPEKTTCYNQVNRSAVKACLYEKGWYETDKDGNRK